MKKLDRRVVRTHKALCGALVEFSLERGYGAFSVKDLTDRADVSYPTFYRHFKNIDDLLTFAVMTEMKALKQVIDAAETPYGEAVAKFRHISGNPDIYRLYLSLPDENPARQAIVKKLEIWFHERFEARDASTVPLELAMKHVIDACIELERWYLDRMEQYRPEEIAAIYSDLLLRSMSSVAISPREEWLNRFRARPPEV